MEREVTSAFKTMVKCAKVFAARELPACAENCALLRDEVTAFRPCVPLVQALRNPGMRERHWDALSESLGVDMHLADSFNLTLAQVRVVHELPGTCTLPRALYVVLICIGKRLATIRA